DRLRRPAFNNRSTDAPYVPNVAVRSHNPFREIESAIVRHYPLNYVPDKPPIFRVYERHVFRDGWRLAAWGEAMDREQLGRPVVETGGVECPAAGVTQPLSLRKVELGLLEFLDIEVNPDPIQERSILRPQGF